MIWKLVGGPKEKGWYIIQLVLSTFYDRGHSTNIEGTNNLFQNLDCNVNPCLSVPTKLIKPSYNSIHFLSTHKKMFSSLLPNTKTLVRFFLASSLRQCYRGTAARLGPALSCDKVEPNYVCHEPYSFYREHSDS